MSFASSKIKVAVIGDSIIDEYVECEVNRISPEAPVPVAKMLKKRELPGGALNVAINFATLGAEVSLFSAVGEDFNVELPSNIDISFLARIKAKSTVRKSRICCDNKQLLRVDVDETFNSEEVLTTKAIDAVGNGKFHIVALADYGLGVLKFNPALGALLSDQRFIALDPHPRNFDLVEKLIKNNVRIDLIKPNAAEFQGLCKCIPGFASLKDGKPMSSIQSLLLTEGAKGMTYCGQGKQLSRPAQDVQVFDVSGAGDAVFAAFCCALRANIGIGPALDIASLAAQTVITKFGTAPIDVKQFNVLWENLK